MCLQSITFRVMMMMTLSFTLFVFHISYNKAEDLICSPNVLAYLLLNVNAKCAVDVENPMSAICRRKIMPREFKQKKPWKTKNIIISTIVR